VPYPHMASMTGMATFLIATGGIYDAQTQMASFNFVEPYLRSVFGVLGVKDATSI
jgi:FMN-dependent NADH-azoreductase